MRVPFLTLSIAALTACGPTPYIAPDVDDDEVVQGQFVIGGELDAARAAELGLSGLGYNEVLGAGLYQAVDGATLGEVVHELASEGRGIELVEHNVIAYAYAVNDPYRPYQWNFDMLSVESAWVTATGDGVTVAVIDTGVSRDGEDTPARMTDGYDFAAGDDDPSDVGGHGTHVAGTIAQATNNGRGVAGMAPDATVMPVRVLGDDGSGSSWDVAQGIVYAVDHGADVINLSLGSPYPAAIYKQAIDYAVDNGVVVVAASGNEYATEVGYPAGFDGVIAVGAVGDDRRIASYSNTGSALDVVAPGGTYGAGILQETVQHGSAGYQYLNGTSMASPHVAALAALLIEAGAEPDEVDDILADTSTDLGDPGWDEIFGHGLIDPVAALGSLAGPPADDPPPADTIDTAAPSLFAVSHTRSGESLTVTWATDELATSAVEFEGYPVFAGDGSLASSHERRFTISAGGTYRYRVRSADTAGNEAVGSWRTSSP